MDIKCAAFALVVLTVMLDLTETQGTPGAAGLVDNPHVRHKRAPPTAGIIKTRDNVKLHSDLQKREKRSVEEADILHNPHVRHKRAPPAAGIIKTRDNVKLHSDLQKREKRSVEEADILHNHQKWHQKLL